MSETDTLQPRVPSRDPWPIRIVGAVCAATGIGALLAHVAGVISMPFMVSFVSLPATLALVVLGVRAGRVGRIVFQRRLWVGVVAGAIATAGYDLSRLSLTAVLPQHIDPFRAHRHFGGLMLSTDPQTTAALIAGWGYHFWNGLSFAVMFTLIARRPKLRWAIAWAILLESATIAVTPSYTNIDTTTTTFVAVSLFGHLVYGLFLGVSAKAWLPRFDHDRPLALDAWALVEAWPRIGRRGN